MALDAAYATRLQALFAWRRDFMDSNTNSGGAFSPNFLAVSRDMNLADTVTDIFARGLSEVYGVPAAASAWDDAYSAMQADLAWLSGVGTMPGTPGKRAAEWVTYQGGAAGDVIWVNHWVGRKYFLHAVRRAGVVVPFSPSFPDSGSEGWTDPYDPVWTADATPFTVTVTVNGVEWALDYQLWTPGCGFGEGVPGTGGGAQDLYISPSGVPSDEEERVAEAVQQFVRRYSASMDYCRTLAGIVPKSNPSSSVAGGCWVDHGDDHWWVDTDGYFLPAFTNQAYISCRRNTETGVPYSTMEFGFGLVVACPDRLKAGDELVLRIESVDSLRPYSVGDEAVIHTVGAGPAWLSGGVDGTDVQTWRVLGSVSGALPDYVVPTNGAPAPVYAQAGVALRLALGGIAFQLGDAFSFSVEAGQFRWRRAGGAWSALADIPAAGALALDDGLQVFFDAGAAPSFVPGDAYDFAVHQPFAASHVQDAQASAWGWEGSSAELVLDLGAAQPIGAIALARYQLPGGAAVAAQVSQDGLAWQAPVALDVSRAVSVAVFHLPMVARFVRFSVTNAPGGHIGWVWCGQPLALSNHASSCRRERRWAATRASGINAPALYAGVGDGWQLGWDERLSAQDVAALLCLGDWAQQMDEPLILLPHYLHPGDAALVRWGADALQMSDVHEYQPDSAHWRRLSATLDLDPVFA